MMYDNELIVGYGKCFGRGGGDDNESHVDKVTGYNVTR